MSFDGMHEFLCASPHQTRPRRYVRVKEACEYGGFGKSKAYKMIDEGKIDAYKDGVVTLIH
jgi:excisionase family DNA binding protein